MIEVSPRKSCLFTSPLAPLRTQRGESEVFVYPFCSLPCLLAGKSWGWGNSNSYKNAGLKLQTNSTVDLHDAIRLFVDLTDGIRSLQLLNCQLLGKIDIICFPKAL